MWPPTPLLPSPRATSLLFLAASLLAAPAASGFIDPEEQQLAALRQTDGEGEEKASGGPQDGYAGGDAPAAAGGGDGEEREEGSGTLAARAPAPPRAQPFFVTPPGVEPKKVAPAFTAGLGFAGAAESQALESSAGRQVMGQFMNAFARNMRKSVLEDSRGDMPESDRQRLLREIAAQERGVPADAALANASGETSPAEASRAGARPRRRLRMLNGGRIVDEESSPTPTNRLPAQGAADADPAADAPRMLDGAQRSLVRMLNALGGGASPRPEPASVHVDAAHRRRRRDGFVVDRTSGQHVRKLFSGGPLVPSAAEPSDEADLRTGCQKVWDSIIAGTWIIVTGLM